MSQQRDMSYEKSQINLVEIHAPYEIKKGTDGPHKGKPRILTNGSSLTVENYVKKVFENKGYTVVRGGDLGKFLRFCCGGWTGYMDEAHGKEKFVVLNNRNRSICNSGMISKQWNTMIDNAYHMWSLYHQNYSPKLILTSKLCEAVKIFEEDEIIRLLKMYSQSYAQDVDWFVFNKKTKDRQFVEVKSRNDSIRYTQLKFSLDVSKLGKNLFTVVYVFPNNIEELDKVRDKARITKAHLDRAAKDLRKLYRIGADTVYRVYKVYEKNLVSFARRIPPFKDIEMVAQGKYGVNPNCLLFFLKKTKNVCMDIDYDEKKLWGGDKYFGMKEYLSRLESEWHELRTVGLLLKENEPNKSNEVVEKLNKETIKEKLTSTNQITNLCVNCWLSGDCEREKKAIKKREIITDCRGYFPENK